MEIEAKSVLSIRDLEDQAKDPGWVFRGQRNAGWPLATSLERVCETFEADTTKHGAKIEQILLREFQRRFHHYRSLLPLGTALLEWLAYMQHYGAPTRLLDWTYSLHVALYFAIEVPDKAGYAVWSINLRWLQEQAFECIKANPRYYKSAAGNSNIAIERFLTGVPLEEDAGWLVTLFEDRCPPNLVFSANPFRLNERLTIQKGLFLALGNPCVSFEENLKSLRGWQDRVRKFTISPEARLKLLRELDLLNINGGTLFPGLEGFARSLSVFHHRTSELSKEEM